MFGNYYNYSPYGAMPDTLAQYRQGGGMPQAPAAPQNNNGVTWVQGEAGAKSFLVAPGNTVMLMDSENSVFYLKSTDVSGMPMPLRIFDYAERNTGTQPTSNIAPQHNFDPKNYVTHEEFNELKSKLDKLMKGDIDNA